MFKQAQICKSEYIPSCSQFHRQRAEGVFTHAYHLGSKKHSKNEETGTELKWHWLITPITTNLFFPYTVVDQHSR